MLVRDATDDDLPALVAMFNYAVRDTTANDWPVGGPFIPQDSMVCKSVGPEWVPFGPWATALDLIYADGFDALVPGARPYLQH